MTPVQKPIIILTFPRTGSSRLVMFLQKTLSISNRYVKVPGELTDCRQTEYFPALSNIILLSQQQKIFVTKLHLNRFMHFDHSEILYIPGLLNWIECLKDSCNFVVVKRLNELDTCISYIKAQHTSLWCPAGGANLEKPIIVSRSAVEEFKIELSNFNSLCGKIDVNIPVITYESLYQNPRNFEDLRKICILPKKICLGQRYNSNGHETDIANILQVKEWMN
jgi:uncharacterized protein (UPF0212 family)